MPKNKVRLVFGSSIRSMLSTQSRARAAEAGVRRPRKLFPLFSNITGRNEHIYDPASLSFHLTDRWHFP